MRWISVDERLPKDETLVFCYHPMKGRFIGMRSRIEGTDFDVWSDSEESGIMPPTHWMPLPPPPEPEQKVSY